MHGVSGIVTPTAHLSAPAICQRLTDGLWCQQYGMFPLYSTEKMCMPLFSVWQALQTMQHGQHMAIKLLPEQ